MTTYALNGNNPSETHSSRVLGSILISLPIRSTAPCLDTGSHSRFEKDGFVRASVTWGEDPAGLSAINLVKQAWVPAQLACQRIARTVRFSSIMPPGNLRCIGSGPQRCQIGSKGGSVSRISNMISVKSVQCRNGNVGCLGFTGKARIVIASFVRRPEPSRPGAKEKQPHRQAAEHEQTAQHT